MLKIMRLLQQAENHTLSTLTAKKMLDLTEEEFENEKKDAILQEKIEERNSILYLLDKGKEQLQELDDTLEDFFNSFQNVND